MQIKKADIQKIFNKLGLEVRSTKHRYGWFIVDGQKILRVHYSHGKGDVSGKVGDKIRNQLRLSQEDFVNLLSCPLTLEQYIAILREKGML